jgi:hypothetical protein
MSSQQQPSRDREWEHWPGRRDDDDDGIRHRLRALFSSTATPSEAAVEELIAARGRELELRAGQLAATVADLQRREERARELRSAVEDLLRRGSSELDERHAELNTLAVELSRREEAAAAAESELADRRRELGAVELRRAALERRESALAERESTVARIASELQDREAQLEELRSVTPAAAPDGGSEVVEASHLVWSAGDRYRIVERPGAAPAPGSVIELESSRWRVLRIGASPLPADRRRCAVVEPLGDADA